MNRRGRGRLDAAAASRAALFALVLALLIGAGLWSPASAQQKPPPRPRILVFKSRDNSFFNQALQGFTQGLKARGYEPGRGVDMVTLTLGEKPEADARLVREQLAGKKPKLVVTIGTDATRLVAAERPGVPVIFSMVLDPVRLGFVRSLERPGGDLTGTTLTVSPGKQLDSLLQAAPTRKRVGVLHTDGDQTSLAFLDEAKQDASKLGAQIVPIAVPAGKGSGDALEALKGRVDALWLIADPASSGKDALAATLEFARAQKLPILGASTPVVRAGALLALSANVADLGDVTAEMTANVLDGNTAPAEMRVRGPRRTTLAVNLEAARTLGVTFPEAVLHLADEVFDPGKGGAQR